MLKAWIKEQWYEIKYAHKSVWTSMAFFILLTGYGVWAVEEYNYSSQIKDKDQTIAILSAQMKQLQQAQVKCKPKSSLNPGDWGMLDDLKESTREKLDSINNDINNGIDNTVNDVQTETHNAATNIHNDLHKSYRKSVNKLNNDIDGIR